jgi:hypothetical protein
MKDRSLFFLVLSASAHILFIVFFFEKVILSINSTGETIPDSLFYAFDSTFTLPNDSTFFSVENDESLFYGLGILDQEKRSVLQSELLRYLDSKYSHISDSYINDVLSGKISDLPLAMSELLRKAALKQLLQQMNKTPARIPAFDPDSLSKWLTEILKKLMYDDKKQNSIKDLIEPVITDQDLLKLWEQMVMKSIMEIGLEKIKKALQDALVAAEKQCLGNKSGDCPVPSFGNGGPLFGAEPDQKFLKEFRKQFKEFSGPFLSLLSSLMGAEHLEQFLLGNMSISLETKGSVKTSLSKKVVEELDFSGLIEDAVKRQQKSDRQMRQFFDTFEQGFGKEISEMMGKEGMLDEEGNIAKNIITQYADDYLKQLQTISENYNFVMPDLELYAKAALNIRNRGLKENGILEIGRGIQSVQDTEQFIVPKQIFIRGTIKEQTVSFKDSGLCKPAFYTHAWGGAPRAEKQVIIDGYLDEWKHANRYKYKLTGARQGNDPLPAELESCNYLLTQWDNRGFYFAYEINDSYDNECSLSSFWDTDALELFFDPNNSKDSLRVSGRSFQFWVWPRVKRNWGLSGESVFLSPNNYEPRLLKADGIQVASRRNGNRYTCEVWVSQEMIKKGILLPGKIIGFNYSINNGNGIYIRWVTNKGLNISSHPNLWGDLLLMGSTAHIAIEPQDYILPGQSVKVSIIDHDMNFTPGKQERVIVKIRSKRTKDFLLCTCVETGANTGVFFTTINTTFGLDALDKKKLSVLPGDILELYYLDQHASGGRVNIPVRQFVQVGRGVFMFANE